MVYKRKIIFRLFDNESLNQVHKRVFFACSIFIIIYIFILFKLTDVMIISNTENIASVAIKEKVLIDLNNKRGSIYDRNGVLLAASVRSYSLSANSKIIKNKINLSKQLSDILNIEQKKLLSKLNQKKKFFWIKRDISPIEHIKINNIGEIGLQVHKEQMRIYPQGNLTSHIVGYTDIDEDGLAGIEKGLNKSLKKNNDITLSLDLRLQNVVREELKITLDKFDALGGVGIILDINNGQILAASSMPDFNPNNLNLSPLENRFNSATQGVFEMGSTFKPITMAIGYDSDTINDKSLFQVNKPLKVDKFVVNDHRPMKGPFNIREIIVNSSNIGTAQVAKKIGKKIHKKYLKEFGLLNRYSLEIPEIGTPIVPNPWLPINTMTIGYGYGLSITPIHLCTIYGALVNDGKIINPTFIKKPSADYTSKVITNETSAKIRQLLRAVILETEWTGPRAKVIGYEVGGKTGTAEMVENNSYLKKANLSSFIGVFPMSKPEYAILIMIKNPKGIDETYNNTTGAWVAAPAVSNVIKRMVHILGIPPFEIEEFYEAQAKLKKNKEFSSATF